MSVAALHAPALRAPATPLVEARGLTKVYGEGDAAVEVLKGVDLDVHAGETVALTGPSGSGKSTLLNLLGCLDRPTRGTYRLDGRDVSRFDRTEQAQVRLRLLGFVFQSFHLLPDLDAVENVMLPLRYAGVAPREARSRAEGMLARVGLADRLGHRPSQLSGGQKQRVAIARACVTRPRLLFADEPTGALDTATGESVMALLAEMHREERLTVVIVTHDLEVAAWAERRVDLRDGVIVS